jgi:hypothetical protein
MFLRVDDMGLRRRLARFGRYGTGGRRLRLSDFAEAEQGDKGAGDGGGANCVANKGHQSLL